MYDRDRPTGMIPYRLSVHSAASAKKVLRYAGDTGPRNTTKEVKTEGRFGVKLNECAE